MWAAGAAVAVGLVALPASAAGDEVAAAGAARVKLARIPPSADIVFHDGKFIYALNVAGGRVTRITFEHPRPWEHVAVSHDGKRIAGNAQVPGPDGRRVSQVWVFDLERGTETRLLPRFEMTGNGGVDWDRRGYVYFAAVERTVPDPKTPADFMANAGANDVYRVRYDGRGAQRLTRTGDRGEADVSVSADGKLVAFMATRVDPDDPTTELWVMRVDGRGRRLVFRGGRHRVSSVHDPELAPGNRRLVFSRVNPDFTNFPQDPVADTAHDLYTVRLDGRALRRVTEPGPISIVPDWVGDTILFLELNDQEEPPYLGLATVRSDGAGYRRIRRGARAGKWIP